MNSEGLYLSSYKISFRDDLNEKEEGITPEIKLIIRDVYNKVINKDKNVLDELKDLIRKYPNVPQFKHYLSTYYILNGKNLKAHKINIMTNKEHPDYLFGKLALANDFIDMKLYHKVPKLMGDIMELKNLYPERDEFHFSEVEGFLVTTIRYYIGIKNLEAAESHLAVLKDLSPDYQNLQALQKAIFAITLEKGLERWENEKRMSRTVKAKAKNVVPESKTRPQFENKIIEKLYENSFDISPDLIREILSIDRNTLIEDLHKVLYDSIARFKYFSKHTKWDNKTHNFVPHALFILTEIKSETSLQILLDLFRQDRKFIDYWFSDSTGDLCWQAIYTLGFNRLDAISDYMKEQDRDTYVRAEVSSAVAQIALHNPSRKYEIIDWYREIFNYFLQHQSDNRILDTDLTGLMICDILDLKAKELIPEIETLYQNNLINPGVSGSYTDVLEDFDKPLGYDVKNKIYNIFDKYKDNQRLEPILTDDSDDLENDELEIPQMKIKIGRNDPCPCGSGKKYKKCHGK